MHAHLTHLAHTLLNQSCNGMALTLAAMTAQVTGTTLDQCGLDQLGPACRSMFAQLSQHRAAQLRLQLPDQTSVDISIEAAIEAEQYMIAFHVPSPHSRQWFALYPATMVVCRN